MHSAPAMYVPSVVQDIFSCSVQDVDSIYRKGRKITHTHPVDRLSKLHYSYLLHSSVARRLKWTLDDTYLREKKKKKIVSRDPFLSSPRSDLLCSRSTSCGLKMWCAWCAAAPAQHPMVSTWNTNNITELVRRCRRYQMVRTLRNTVQYSTVAPIPSTS